MKNAVLIIGGSEIGAQKVSWARECGLCTVVVDRDSTTPGMRMADYPIAVSRNDEYQIISQALMKSNLLVYRGVYCGIDIGIKPTVIAQALGVPTISLKAAAIGQHKWLMKQQWIRDGIATPKTMLCDSENQIKRVASSLGFPVILKSPSGSGSRGVMQIDDEKDISAGIENIRRVSGNESILIEQYIDGSMHDVNGFIWNNTFYPCGIMDRYFLPESPCMSAYTFDPTNLENGCQRSIYKLLEAGARSLGINIGPVKGDVVWGCNGPMLLEIAPRFHGDIQTVQTSPLGPGINACYFYFKILATGEVDQSLLKPRMQCAGWKLIPADRAGIFQGIRGKEQAMEIPGVERIFDYRQPGQNIGPLVDNGQIPGVVVAKASNHSCLENIFKEALSVLSADVV